jgi:hypothetical protein
MGIPKPVDTDTAVQSKVAVQNEIDIAPIGCISEEYTVHQY